MAVMHEALSRSSRACIGVVTDRACGKSAPRLVFRGQKPRPSALRLVGARRPDRASPPGGRLRPRAGGGCRTPSKQCGCGNRELAATVTGSAVIHCAPAPRWDARASRGAQEIARRENPDQLADSATRRRWRRAPAGARRSRPACPPVRPRQGPWTSARRRPSVRAGRRGQPARRQPFECLPSSSTSRATAPAGERRDWRRHRHRSASEKRRQVAADDLRRGPPERLVRGDRLVL